MSLPRLSSVAGGSSSKGDPYKEFRCLAEDFRKRQALVHNSKQNMSPGTCSPHNKDTTPRQREDVSSLSPSTGTSALLPPPHGHTNGPQQSLLADGMAEQQPDRRPGVVTGQADNRLRAATAVYRNRENTGIKSGGSTPKKKKTRRSSSGRTHSSSSSRRNTAGRHHHHRETAAAVATAAAAEEAFDEESRHGGGSRLDPRVEAAMVRVFRSDNDRSGCRGVSVSAIRSLYRKRHEREKAAALNEVRRWWKLSSSGMTTAFAEATAAAALLLAPQENGGGEDTTLRETRCGLHNNSGPESDELSQIGNAARGYRTLDSWDGAETATSDRVVEDGSIIATNGTASMNGKSSRDHRIMRETRVAAGDNDHNARSSIFDNLNWRDVLLNDSYREILVRDMKQALRAGRKVKMRAQEDDPLGDGSCRRGDCQLMLRTLYMQSVQVNLTALFLNDPLCVLQEFPAVYGGTFITHVRMKNEQYCSNVFAFLLAIYPAFWRLGVAPRLNTVSHSNTTSKLPLTPNIYRKSSMLRPPGQRRLTSR